MAYFIIKSTETWKNKLLEKIICRAIKNSIFDEKEIAISRAFRQHQQQQKTYNNSII